MNIEDNIPKNLNDIDVVILVAYITLIIPLILALIISI